MASAAVALTVQEFQKLKLPPEKRVELVAGEVIDLGNAKAIHETVKANLHRILVVHDPHARIGQVYSDTMYQLGPYDTRIPDISFRLDGQIPAPVPDDYLAAPALAVEVVSSESAAELMDRVEDHLRGGSRMVWVVYPRSRSVVVYEPNGNARVLHQQDTITVPWLGDFEARISTFFDRI